MDFRDVVRARRSTRAFLPKPVPEELISRVLEDAALAPSNCNTQPWDVHVVTGTSRDRLSAALVRAFEEERRSFDFTFDRADYYGSYAARAEEQGRTYYDAVGVARENREDRRAGGRRNVELFGAPCVALLFMPVFGDAVRGAGDVGMYGQNFLLSLVAHGLAGIPQTALGFFSDVAREELGVDPSLKLLFGISFGYPDEEALSASYRSVRAPLSEYVTFHR